MDMVLAGRAGLARTVVRSLAVVVAEGAERYERRRILPRLLPVAVDELGPDGAATTRRICLLLARALRRERTRGRAGHWSYDLNRHLGLLQAYRAERERLAEETRKGPGPRTAPSCST